ncbi:MAG TPA: hypothetical protein VM939_07800 [Gemmatimonadaceae bacterium]|nr:hypothetical protein [Gemmatimonadaceae bacterium]
MKSRSIVLTFAAGLVSALVGCTADNAADDAATTSADSATGVASAPLAPPAEAVPATAAPSAGMADPNNASAAELTAIPGVTQEIADAIVAGRPYSNMTAVDKVLAGKLAEPARDSVYARLWKPIDLNSASGAEIMLIPGVGARMRHEFEEYRPYKSIEQFRREIGKYVDSTEVARLERFVTIK